MPAMRIGELARNAGINTRTLRYYDRIGLLAPSSRTAAGYRVYTVRDAERLAFIRRAQGIGLSLAEIAEIIAVRSGGAAPCGHVRTLAVAKIAEIDARIAELEALGAEMRRLAERARDVEPTCYRRSSVCAAIEESSASAP